MRLKERRHHIVIQAIRNWLLDSNVQLEAVIVTNEIRKNLTEFAPEEINGVIKYLFGKEYLAPYTESDKHSLEKLKLTFSGLENWIFPEGFDNQNKIFLSHASEDKKFAAIIKNGLVELGFNVFLAHEDIPGTSEWRDRLITELSTSGLFIALRTPNYNGKAYTEQECGFALAQKKRVLTLFIGTKSKDGGFCSAFQGGEFEKEDCPQIIDYCKKQIGFN